MRIFHNTFSFSKETDEKLRWIRDVDDVAFKIYITKDRVPDPVPNNIEASVFDSKLLYTVLLKRIGRMNVGELNDFDKYDLQQVGVVDEYLHNAGNDAIFGAVCISQKKHTKTVRYDAYHDSPKLEFGDPYIPKSILRHPYPERLLFLIRWIK